MKRKHLLILALSTALLASCGGGNSSAPTSSATQSESSSSSSSSSGRTRTSHSDSSSSSTSKETEAELPNPLPTIEGTQIAYVEGTASGGESDAAANPGKLYEWHGDGGVIGDIAYSNGEYSFNYTPGWQWYSCQLFYRLPYGKAGDNYTVRLCVYSDVKGAITANGNVMNLVWGWNVLTYDIAYNGGVLLSIQLGVASDNSFLQGSYLKMKDIEVYDKVNTYHKVSFSVGDEVKKAIQVRANELVAAPVIDVPDGKTFVGWYDGEEAFDPATPITAPKNYVAKIVNSSEIETAVVSYSFLGEVIATQVTAIGVPAAYSTVAAPFGYRFDDFYLDAAFTELYRTQPITADTTIYIKGHVAPTTYYHNGEVAHEESVGPNGEFVLTYQNNGYVDAWNIQVNFAPLPAGEAGKRYAFSCEYTLVGASNAGSYQIYDGSSITAGEVPLASEFATLSVEYDGAFLTPNNKFTIELGLAKPADGDEGTVVFSVRNPRVYEVA